jgi:hypothetical protein
MAINTSQIDNMAGLDEVVMNQRSRAYTIDNPVATGGAPATTNPATSGGGKQYGTLWMQGTGIPTSIAGSSNQTITAAMLGTGIIVQSPSSAVTWTLDTAANIQTYMTMNSAGVLAGDLMVCDVINAGSSTGVITINAGANGSLDATQASLQMPINTSRTLFIRLTQWGASPQYVVYG